MNILPPSEGGRRRGITGTMKESVQTDQAAPAIGPYSQAVRFGNIVITSGQIPLNAQGELVEGGIAEQTEQVIANLRAVLAEAGTDLEHVVKSTVFLADMNEFASMNAVYDQHFAAPYPARSTVQVARLPRDVRVEIEVIAELA